MLCDASKNGLKNGKIPFSVHFLEKSFDNGAKKAYNIYDYNGFAVRILS